MLYVIQDKVEDFSSQQFVNMWISYENYIATSVLIKS